MTPIPFPDTLVIWRRPAVTFPTMGDQPAAAVSSTVLGAFWSTTSTELVSGQDTVTWDASALLPYGTDVLATDQIEARGALYDVVGQPFAWKSNLTGKETGVQVQLKVASG